MFYDNRNRQSIPATLKISENSFQIINGIIHFNLASLYITKIQKCMESREKCPTFYYKSYKVSSNDFSFLFNSSNSIFLCFIISFLFRCSCIGMYSIR